MRGGLAAAVGDTARRYPNRNAIWFNGTTTSWRELDGLANQLARQLQTLGVTRRTILGIHSSNRPEMLALITAASRLGSTVALFNTAQKGDAFHHSLSISRSEWLITEDVEALPKSNIPYVSLTELLTSARVLPKTRVESPRIAPSDAAFYIFTSGTTGFPKASIMSHRRWIKAAFGYGCGMLRLKPMDVLYNTLPLYHNLATTIAWGSCVATGACFALAESFSARRFWHDCRSSGATAISYIGELPRYLLAQPPTKEDRLHSVRLATGVGLRHAIWDDFRERFGIKRVAEFYGSSEGNTVFLNLFGLDHTVGFSPTPHVLVEYDSTDGNPVSDAQGYMTPVAPNEQGLLLSRITKRFPYDGYTDSHDSQKKLITNPFGKGHTYVNTGDILRKIGCGHAVFVDRVGDTFRWKGENVATLEVETVLDRFPTIQESSVYGVNVPDVDGKPGMAAIVADAYTLDLDALYAHCRAQLPEYAVPQYLRVHSKMALTQTFKHQRAATRDLGLRPVEGHTIFERTGDTPWSLRYEHLPRSQNTE